MAGRKNIYDFSLAYLSKLSFAKDLSKCEVSPGPLPVRVERQLVLGDGRQGRVFGSQPRPVGRVDGRALLLDPDDRGHDRRLGPDVLTLDDDLLGPLRHGVRVGDRLERDIRKSEFI